MLSDADFINTPLQRGDAIRVRVFNRFGGFSFCRVPDAKVETAKVVERDPGRLNTPLKRGVNESRTFGYIELLRRSFK